jgi:hypothetical protein
MVIEMRPAGSALVLGLWVLAGPALAQDEALRATLRGPLAGAEKLEALERAVRAQGRVELEKKDYEALNESVRSELAELVTAGNGLAAVALWNRYLKALPRHKDSEKHRRFPPALEAAVRLQQARAEALYEQEDYLGAWRLAAGILDAGSDLEAARALQRKASAAGALASRIDELLARTGLSGSEPGASELSRVGEELARLHAPEAVPRRTRAVRLLGEARALNAAGNLEATGRKIEQLASLGVATEALKRELQAEPAEVLVGEIRRTVEAPAPTQRATAQRPTQAATPKAAPPAASTNPPRPASPTSAPAQTLRPEPPRAVSDVSRPEAERRLPPDVRRRAGEVARREAAFYRHALQAAGAGPAVPRFHVQAVSVRERTAEIHLLATGEGPEARVVALALPNADRQFLRLLAHKVLEEAPELARAEVHVALQNGRSAPLKLGMVRIEAELLKLTAGQPVEEFWSRLDGRGLDPAWRAGRESP